MSRKILKKSADKISSSDFQFQSTMDDFGSPSPVSASSLEAEAELDSFDGQVAHHGSHYSQPEVNVEEIIERAQQDASAIVQDAKQQAAEIERNAYEKGLEEGRKTGEIMADQQLQAILTQYHAALTGLDQLRELMLNQMQLDVFDLIVHTAQKVVNAELTLNPQAILPMVKGAIQSLKQRKNLTIFLNADDHQFVLGMSDMEKQKWFGTQTQVEIDSGLSRGAFRIETPAGELDADIDEHLQRLKEELRKAFGKQ